MKILLLTQARISSSRFPAKILEGLGDSTVLDLHIKRAKKSKLINVFCVATTTEQDAKKILDICRENDVKYYQGSVDDVLDRFYQAALPLSPTHIVRVTSDCPLLDPSLIDQLIEHGLSRKVDYASNCLVPTLPDGQSVEFMTFEALEKAWKESKLKSEREHVTPFIWKNSDIKDGQIFRAFNASYSPDMSQLRMTLDYPEDLEVLRRLVTICGPSATWNEYASALLNDPILVSTNARFKRGEGYLKSVDSDTGGLTVELVQNVERDAKTIMNWRNDPQTLASFYDTRPKVWDKFWPEFQNNYFNDSSLPAIFVFLSNDRVAFVRFKQIEDPRGTNEKTCDISVNVNPDFRGKGLGAQSIAKASQFAIGRGFKNILAEIKLGNLPSIRSFEKAGYKRLDQVVKHIDITGEDCAVERYLFCDSK